MFGATVDVTLVTLFATVWATVCGIVIGLVIVASRDKKLILTLGSKFGGQFANAIVGSPVVIGMISPLVSAAIPIVTRVSKWMNGETVEVSTSATIKDSIMSIPFKFRRHEWKLMIVCDQSKEDSETKWIVDGVDIKHCPMLGFQVTKVDLNVDNIVVVEEEEIQI